MTDATFGSILETLASDVEAPKPLPGGTYHCVVEGQPRMDKTTRKGTEFVEFSLKPIAALEDVNQKDLKAALTSADGTLKPLSDKRIRATYYLTPDALIRLKRFLADDLGIEIGRKKVNQMIAEAQNRQVLAFTKLVPSEDGQVLYNNLVKTAPVAE